MLCSIWSEVLHLDRVGIDDNFFEFGGHSLLATQVMSRIRQVLQTEVQVRVLFEAPTIRLLAQEISKSSRADSPPIVVFDRKESGIPLSFAQQRLWFLDQLEPGTAQYNIPAGIRIDGSLDEALLLRSLNEIVRRHESLRTTFRTDDGTPVQVIAPSFTLTLRRKDLTSVRPEIREEEAQRLATEEATTPFSLTEGPLLRVFIIRLEEDSHLLIFTIHHIITDGWSTGVLVRELATLYRTFLNNEPSPLSPLPVQYADFAAWQRAWLQGDVIENELAYWKKALQNAPSSLSLPTDRPRPAVVTERGAIYPFTLSREIGHAINRLNKQEGVTTFMTLLAAFQTLLYKYTGEQDMCIGTPVANRNRVETEGLIGLFVNTLVMRGDLSGNPTFRALLARVRETALGAYAHQDTPFEKVVGAVAADRDMSHTPLFQVMFILQNAPHDPLELPGLTMTYVPIDSGISLFDLTLTLEETHEGLTGRLEYSTDLFDASTIARMVEHFQTLLLSALEHPNVQVSALEMMADTERNRVLVEWNDTKLDFPNEVCFHQAFEEQVLRSPDAVAVVYEMDRLTFAELNLRSNRLAHYLRSLGVGPDTLVGVAVDRCVDLLVGVLGILKAGGAYVPLDPSYPAQRLRIILDDAGATIVVGKRSLVELGEITGRHVVLLDDHWPVIEKMSGSNPENLATSNNLAYVIFTSGSTGRPKGVMIEHRSMMHLGAALQQEIYSRHQAAPLQISLNASLNFDASVQQIVMLSRGHTLHIVPQDIRLDGEALLKFVRESELDVFDCVPSQLKLLLEVGLFGEDNWVPSILLPGGEPIDHELWRTLASVNRSESYNMYGPTECTVDSTIGIVREHSVAPTIGKPVANVTMYVLDEQKQIVALGIPGELFIGGEGVGRGYAGRADLTAERFLPNPYSHQSGARMYRTGDVVRYRNDGTLEFLGRIDEQIKIRGFRVELGEIEAVLRGHKYVRNAVVVAREIIPNRKRLVAYVVPAEKSVLTVAELRESARAQLPEYMVPSAFVLLESLPLTPNGKLDRRALPDLDHERPDFESEFIAPRTPVEISLAKIWQELLGLSQVGVRENFFELGGDSIVSIQVVARARHAGIHLTPKHIFLYPTIEELALHAGAATTISVEQGLVTGPVPLTPIQRWFFEQDFVSPHHWNQSVLLEVKEPLERNLLEQVVGHLMHHHDALRMRFQRTDDGWVQCNAGAVDDVPLEWIDVRSLEKVARRTHIERRASELQQSLNLTNGPLMRVAYFDAGADDNARLLIIVHHLVMDGVSWRILLEDFQTLYSQREHRVPPVLPPKTTSFKQWAERLNEYAQSGALVEESRTWQKLLSPRLAWKASRLPLDFENANVDESTSEVLLQYLDQQSTADLRSLSDVGLRVEEVLLGTLVKAFRHLTKKGSLLVDLEKHGRESVVEGVDVSRTVGWFTTIFPLILDSGRAGANGETIPVIAEQMNRIPNNGIGYALLRYASDLTDVRNQMIRFPQPMVCFNYHGKFDGQASSVSRFALAAENSGRERGEDNLRSHPLGVDCRIIQERLEIAWSYSRNQFKAETVRHLAQEFLDDLRQSVENLRTKRRAEEEAHHFVEAIVAKPSYTS